MLHSRRLRSTLFAGMVAALGATTSLAPARAQPASAPGDQGPPNILFVLVDDMGYGDLSIMGNTKIETPNLDKLAREGVLMTKFYDPAPICSSPRAGFLSGHFPPTVHFVATPASRATMPPP